MTNSVEPMWALAAGCVPDANPWDIPRIAQSGGFGSSGMWVEPETTWDSGALEKTKAAIRETGLALVDVEVVWLEKTDQATDGQKLVVEVGLELGAKNVLVVSRHDDLSASVSQFHQLCELAGDDIRVCLEFGEFTSIKNLTMARSFIDQVDHRAAGILIDLMHINRSGDVIPELDDRLFPYVQACDFWQASADMTGMDYITAAVDDRCPLGEGEARGADLKRICQSNRDVSLEIRSKALRDEFPDPFDRSKQIFERCRRDAFSGE
jgi:sugar phosphate isomerase/epimerase